MGWGVEDFPLLAGQILHVSFCGAAAVTSGSTMATIEKNMFNR